VPQVGRFPERPLRGIAAGHTLVPVAHARDGSWDVQRRCSLGLDADNPKHLFAVRALGSVSQQDPFTHAGLTHENQGGALLMGSRYEQVLDRRQLGCATVQPLKGYRRAPGVAMRTGFITASLLVRRPVKGALSGT
jgi:hypothetical protein